MPSKTRTLILVHLKEIGLCCNIVSQKSVHPLYQECLPFQIGAKRITKMYYFLSTRLREIRWSDLSSFFLTLLTYFNGPLKILQHNFYWLKLHIYGEKVGKKIEKSCSQKKLFFFFISSFQKQIRWSALNILN